MQQLLSPKQVAKSMGVSESSLKRWCDQGTIPYTKTPGGHRRLRVGDVVRFLREKNRDLVDAEAIGLPSVTAEPADLLANPIDPLTAALAAGDEAEVRQIIVNCYLAGKKVVHLCENLLTPAMHKVGDLWTCGSIEVYHERQACEIVNRTLYELRSMLPVPPASAPRAIGGAPTRDNYRLATAMVEMILVEAGWNATSLGSDLPYRTLSEAAQQTKPALMWLSLTATNPMKTGNGAPVLVDELADFQKTLPDTTQLIVGGRALAEAKIKTLPGIRICKRLSELAELDPNSTPVTFPATDAPTDPAAAGIDASVAQQASS
ncbi:MAG: B12-binding domain-containing protein [Planctomycetota bacterium]